MWGKEKVYELLRVAGVNTVEKKNLSHDIQNNYYIVRVEKGSGGARVTSAAPKSESDDSLESEDA
jgi:hypothetical protein